MKLYGHNWDTFLTKAEVLMKDDLPFIKEFVKVCGEVTYGELPAIIIMQGFQLTSFHGLRRNT
ncbi:MAG: hypothetical protein ACLS9K_14085 [Lachnospira eligens]